MTKTNLVGLVLCFVVVSMFAVWQNNNREAGQFWGHVNAEAVVGGATCCNFVVTRCLGSDGTTASSSCAKQYCHSYDGNGSWVCPTTATTDVSNGEYLSQRIVIESSGIGGWYNDGETTTVYCTLRVACGGGCVLDAATSRIYCAGSTSGGTPMNPQTSYTKGNACGG